MNERIFELLNRASDATSISSSGPNQVSFAEKFAEMLIQECCEVINAAKPGVDQLPPEVALDMATKNVKAYFGV
jgi:hypothetical protein